MQSQKNIFLQVSIDLLVCAEDLVMDLYLELEALIEVTVGDDFDDDERQGRDQMFLAGQHALHL
jgi:hypothetical protein